MEMLKEALTKATDAPVMSFRDRILAAHQLDDRHDITAPPDWLASHGFIGAQHRPAGDTSGCNQVGDLGELPWNSQERTVLDELLMCLSGVSGDHLKITEQNVSFSKSLHPTLKETVRQISPLIVDFVRVSQFVAQAPFLPSQVLQAMAAGIRHVLREHLVLVAQLESQLMQCKLTAHSLWFYVQPNIRTMRVLADLIDRIHRDGLTSGETLSLLSERRNIGDERARRLCGMLFEEALMPYLDTLAAWVRHGVVRDPYSEFLVRDCGGDRMCEVGYDDDYWEKRYSLQLNKAPGFLLPHAELVLRAGKYLNVLKHSKCDIESAMPGGVQFDDGASIERCVDTVRATYNLASKALLQQLMNKNDLVGRLRSIKHYYMMARGDFIIQLIHLCESELSKNIDDVLPTRLHNLLDLAVRTSTVNSDQYKDDLHPELIGYDLTSQMTRIHSIETADEQKWMPAERLTITGLEAFTFDTHVHWPVSLVINRKSIACYQMIFRLLFQCKLLETQLCRVWVRGRGSSSSPLAHILCQRMLVTMQNMMHFMSSEVLEPSWHVFFSQVNKVANFDEVISLHASLLNECMSDCMLQNIELLGAATNLFNVCRKFVNYMQNGHVRAETGVVGRLAGEERISHQLQRTFSEALLGVMQAVSEHHRLNFSDRLLALLFRLDYNGFYMRQLEARSREKSRGSSSDATASSTSV